MNLQKKMAMYVEKGVKGIYIQGGDHNVPFGELYAYVSAKLLWDPSMSEENFEKIMKKFMEHYYGTGTYEPLTEYIDLMNRSLDDMHYHLYGLLFEDFAHLDVIEDANGARIDTSKVIDPAKDCFDRAEALVSDETQKAHLSKARTQIKLYELLSLFKLEEKYENAVFDADYRRALGEELYNDAKAAGFTSYAETGGTSLVQDPNFNKPPYQWHHKQPF